MFFLLFRLMEKVKGIEEVLKINSERLQKLQHSLELVAKAQRERDKELQKKFGSGMKPETLYAIAILSLVQILLFWLFFKRG